MPIDSLGYVGIRSDKLDDWATFGPQFLGLQLVERTPSALKFRMDDRKQRIIVSNKDLDTNVFGWEVESAEALEALAARLEEAKHHVEVILAAELSILGVTAGIRFLDPVGNRLEAFYGQEVADIPFIPGRSISGFRTGSLGMGHVVIHVPRIEDLLWFYEDVLGFRLSDYTIKPFKAYFFHVNPRHHSLAMVETGKSAIHHLMMELFFLDDIGQTYDIALSEPGRIATTLGRHSNDFMTSFYARTPSDFLVEYGWGGRSIDPRTWQPLEMTHGTSLWGHERNWAMPPDQLAEAKRLRAKAAEEGLRYPVLVEGENFHVGPSSCAWWEDIKRQQ